MSVGRVNVPLSVGVTAFVVLALFAGSLGGCSTSPAARDLADAGSVRDSASSTDTGSPGSSGDSGSTCLFCTDAGSFDASLTVRVKDEIDLVCSNMDGCHGTAAGNMTLSVGDEFGQMINVTSYENPPMKRVLPGVPLQSYVYLKLWCDGGITGDCMPKGDPNPATAQLFGEWIEAGAPTE